MVAGSRPTSGHDSTSYLSQAVVEGYSAMARPAAEPDSARDERKPGLQDRRPCAGRGVRVPPRIGRPRQRIHGLPDGTGAACNWSRAKPYRLCHTDYGVRGPRMPAHWLLGEPPPPGIILIAGAHGRARQAQREARGPGGILRKSLSAQSQPRRRSNSSSRSKIHGINLLSAHLKVGRNWPVSPDAATGCIIDRGRVAGGRLAADDVATVVAK